MGSSDSGSTSGPTESRSLGAGASRSPALEGGRPRSGLRVWAIALAGGVAAGLLAWLGGEVAHGFFRPRLYQVEVIAIGTTWQPSRESQQAADLRNAALAYAILGCATGLAMGVAGGIAGGAPGRGLVVGLAAQAAGGLAAALASLALVPIFFRDLVPDTNDLLTPILIHGGIWMTIGAVGGLAFATGMKCGRHLGNAVGAACIGAFVAAVVYQLISASLFPDSGSTKPLATSAGVRLLATLLVAILVAAGSARGALGRGARSTKAVPAH